MTISLCSFTCVRVLLSRELTLSHFYKKCCLRTDFLPIFIFIGKMSLLEFFPANDYSFDFSVEAKLQSSYLGRLQKYRLPLCKRFQITRRCFNYTKLNLNKGRYRVFTQNIIVTFFLKLFGNQVLIKYFYIPSSWWNACLDLY